MLTPNYTSLVGKMSNRISNKSHRFRRKTRTAKKLSDESSLNFLHLYTSPPRRRNLSLVGTLGGRERGSSWWLPYYWSLLCDSIRPISFVFAHLSSRMQTTKVSNTEWHNGSNANVRINELMWPTRFASNSRKRYESFSRSQQWRVLVVCCDWCKRIGAKVTVT